jgi:hypothetical protein
MMVTVSELEAVIAQTPSGEQVQFDTKLIGSVDHVTRKLTELKLNRSGDPDYLIFVGLDRFGECFLAAFSTIGDPLEFRARHENGSIVLLKDYCRLTCCRATMGESLAQQLKAKKENDIRSVMNRLNILFGSAVKTACDSKPEVCRDSDKHRGAPFAVGVRASSPFIRGCAHTPSSRGFVSGHTRPRQTALWQEVLPFWQGRPQLPLRVDTNEGRSWSGICRYF